MSSARWPSGTLSRVLLTTAKQYPDATATELARIVGCSQSSARTLLRKHGVRVQLGGQPRIAWTDDMKDALVRGIIKRRSAVAIARTIGVTPQTLLSGAAEVIRDLHVGEGHR